MIRCDECGRFIGYDDIANNKASLRFIPDNEFGPEKSEWTCQSCLTIENGECKGE